MQGGAPNDAPPFYRAHNSPEKGCVRGLRLIRFDSGATSISTAKFQFIRGYLNTQALGKTHRLRIRFGLNILLFHNSSRFKDLTISFPFLSISYLTLIPKVLYCTPSLTMRSCPLTITFCALLFSLSIRSTAVSLFSCSTMRACLID